MFDIRRVGNHNSNVRSGYLVETIREPFGLMTGGRYHPR